MCLAQTSVLFGKFVLELEMVKGDRSIPMRIKKIFRIPGHIRFSSYQIYKAWRTRRHNGWRAALHSAIKSISKTLVPQLWFLNCNLKQLHWFCFTSITD